MIYLGDYELGETINFRFVTTAPDTGAPATLSGTPAIAAYVGNSATQITAGITLGVDHDSVTGLNLVTVVLTSGNGYADNTDIDFVITTGTVDGNSAVGYVVGRCTIGRGSAYKRLGAPAGASVSADIAAIEAQTDDIGVAGAGLTAIPWNSAWDAEVQSEVADALNAYDPPTNAELTSGLDALPTAAEIRAEMDSNSTQLAAIVADTNELQTDWADGGRLDLILDARASQTSVDTIDGNVDAILVDTGTTLDGKLDTIDGIVDAIKAKTDSLTFTQAGQVDANIQSINDVAITGDGSETPFDVS